MTGPVQHFYSSILDVWRFSVFAKLSERKGFWCAEYADFKGSLQLLTSSHLRERDKMLLRAVLCGGRLERIPSCQRQDGRCSLPFSWYKGWRWSLILGVYFPPSLQHVRDLPEFATLMSLDRSNWPRRLLWHGWLPGLCDISDNDPWATSFGDLASSKLERCLGAYPVDFAGSWTPPEYWDADDIALEMSEHPNIWN